MKAKSRRQDGAVIWCDRGWQPVNFGFCPSKSAWKKAVKKLGCPKEPFPTYSGCATTFSEKGAVVVIVTLREKLEQQLNRVEIAGLLAHEATHVWQAVRREMQERDPSVEFEAYAVQAIFQGLYQAWLDTRAPEGMLAACARRVTT